MTGQRRTSITPRIALLQALGVIATLAVFAFDIASPSRNDVASLYAVTVLMAGISSHKVVVTRTAVGSLALTFIAFAIKENALPDGVTSAEVFSRAVSAVVISLVAVVVVGMLRRRADYEALGSALRAAEGDRDADRRMLAAASAISAIGTWSIAIDEDRMTMSDEAAVMHGFSAGANPLRSEVLSHMDAADGKILREHVEAAWEHGIPFREEVQITPPGGTMRWIVTMGEKIQLDDDSVARVHGTVQDITPWKEAELSESAERNRFSQLTRSLPIIVWTADSQGHVNYFNEALPQYTGLSLEELEDDGWISTVEPSEIDGLLKSWSEALAAGVDRFDIEYRVRGADGIYRWHHVAAQPERDANGDIVRWWGSTVNVDGIRRLREEADAIAAEREIVLESMSEGVYSLDRDWRVVYMNSSAETILGRTRDTFVGQVLWDASSKTTDSELFQLLSRVMDSGVTEGASHHSDALGKWLDMSVSRSEVGVTVFFRDVTEVRHLSEQLAQSQRLESVGQLTGGIAHDFNNLLTVVLGGADALTADDTLTDDSREMAQLIGSAAERGAELTHRLLAFARRQPLEPQSVDLSGRITQLEPLLRRTLGENISIVVIPDGSTHAEVDPGQFENALLNMAINARDAMPQGGTLTIEVATVTLDDSYVTAHADVHAGTYVVVTVTDSGAGIEAKDMANLFDPFFSTKEMGQGSGLGLAMVWGFVKQSGGHITVYSEPDCGTSFKMYLPTALAAPAPTRSVSVQISPDPTSGTILLAEDDDLVRAFATDRLRAKGYEVIAAASGPAALEALEAMERIDLLFTDVIMPGGMTGRQLADAVVARRPGTPVLYASGYTENVILHHDRLDPGVKLLAKPYSTKQLIERVGELLAVVEQDPS